MKRISPSTYNKLARNSRETLCRVGSFELQKTRCDNQECKCCKGKEHYVLISFKETGYGIEGIYTITQDIAFKLLLLSNTDGLRAFREEVKLNRNVMRVKGGKESYWFIVD